MEKLEKAELLATNCRRYILAGEKDLAAVELDKLERLLPFNELMEEEKLDWAFVLLSLSNEIAELGDEQ